MLIAYNSKQIAIFRVSKTRKEEQNEEKIIIINNKNEIITNNVMYRTEKIKISKRKQAVVSESLK